MTEDKQVIAYNKGFQAGQEHQTSSPQTLTLFKNMQNEIEEIKETLKTLPNKLELELSNRKLVDEVLACVKKDYAQKVDIFDIEGKPKFASKVIEKVILYIGIALGVGFLGIIGKIILSYFKI